ncbi:MAG TPA: hypothetical protein VK826_18110 [Bacteroidia bacterium]|nr:hypothetical protein [Bacteroidia bacterium]
METQTQEQPFETEGHDFSGMASLDLHDTQAFYDFLSKTANYDADRYDPIALKVFVSENQPVVTLYVLDKSAQEKDNYPKDKLPTRKLKLQLSWSELFMFVRRFDLVVTNGGYNIADMVVINK